MSSANQPDSDPNSTSRVRTMTDKGATYQASIKEVAFRRLVSSWRRQAGDITMMLSMDEFNVQQIQDAMTQLENTMTDAAANYDNLEGFLSEIDRSGEYFDVFNDLEREHYNIKKKFSDAINLEKHSTVSHRSSVSRSVSRRSSSSQASDKRAIAAEAAALITKLKFISIESEKKLELDRIQTQMGLEIAKAKLDAINEVEKGDNLSDDDNGVHLPDVDMLDKHQLVDNFLSEMEVNVTPKTPIQDLNPLATQFTPPTHNDFNALITAFADSSKQDRQMYADVVNAGRLAPPEPGIFKGDPLSYPDWNTAFTDLVESRRISPTERMHYLKRYLGGPAKEAVDGYFLLRSPDAYEKARQKLEHRYGSPYVVSEAFLTKLESWPRISTKDVSELLRFSDFLQQCQGAMSTLVELETLNSSRENGKILKKLPDWIITKWNNVVSEARERHGKYPLFCEFANFVAKEADKAMDPISSLQAVRGSHETEKDISSNSSTSKKKGIAARSLTTGTHMKESQDNISKIACPFCKMTNHTLHTCHSFMTKTASDRQDFIKRSGLCFGCLAHGHITKNCTKKSRCKTCDGRHPTSLHGDFKILNPDQRSESTTKDNYDKRAVHAVSNRAIGIDGKSKSSMILPVWISSKDNPEDELLTYALLDTQSDTTFISEEAGHKLDSDSVSVRLKLSTLTSTSIINCQRYTNLQIRGFKSDIRIPLPSTYSRNLIPSNRDHIPTPETARRWPHLQKIANKLTPLQDVNVDILIGYNCPQAMNPRDFISGEPDQPFAQRTDLGWGIVGCVDPNDNHSVTDTIGTTHRIITRVISEDLNIRPDNQTGLTLPTEVHYVCQSSIKEMVTPCCIRNLLERDFSDSKLEEASMSQDDIRFTKIIANGIHQLDDGFYEMPLPFRENRPVLPNNRVAAQCRLECLKRKFTRDEKYRNDYTTFMEDTIKNGDAEKVTQDNNKESTVWYIPHHGVFHKKKVDKIRIVFDCSARYRGTALNDHLLMGPDQINPLVGVLCRFRKEKIAIICDIQKMYHQFRVNPEDRDYLRFLWWDQGNIDTVPTEYRMKVHLFGAASSPGCANYGLKKVAKDNKDQFSHETHEFITNSFYVDDGLTSVDNVNKAIQLVKESREMCLKGNLRLHKFISNSREVINSLPRSECAQNVTDLNLAFEELPIERVLGVEWSAEHDIFQFRVDPKEQPLTRRGILSTIASIYDPLGFLAPFILTGKQILQKMCKDNASWDEPLSSELLPRWKLWISDLPDLTNIKIPRCYKPFEFGEVKCYQLHHFADASESGYGQCTYLRMINQDGIVHCTLIVGKSRVVPLKVMTIPRLELTAAVTSVRISNMLRKELSFDDIEEYFWTDSQVVLGYINNNARRFHTFVANRVEIIRESTKPSQWFYVKSADNPADSASRGLTAKELYNSNWFTGPSFLWERNLITNKIPMDKCVDLQEDDPEVRRVNAFLTEGNEMASILERLKYFSDWCRAVRSVAFIRRSLARKTCTDALSTSSPETEKHNAEMVIIKMMQRDAFAEEIGLLETSNDNPVLVKSTSKLYKLDPFLDQLGLLRVGGRLVHSSLLYGVKHPLILPRDNQCTQLIVKQAHENVAHQGRGMTVCELRNSGFWIIGCSAVVSSHIYKCVACRRLRGKTLDQKMANLPEERIEPVGPFTYCGMDCFGPFYVKDRRTELKRYGLIFTCMSSRAVHIEMLDDMSTDCFINGLRCFLTLRGPIREIKCDQGTNFVGAKHELRRALEEVDNDKLRSVLSEQKCDFVMNTPSSSHMGGVWERHIRTIRSILTVILDQHSARLDTSSLRTFLYETMSIINSRPLSTDNLYDPCGPDPLTPNHLLTMKSKVLMPPPGDFVEEDVYARKRWRKVQFLANEFWLRWKKEYLLGLQVRQRWNKPQRNTEINDVVIIKDENLVRGNWRLGRVLEILPSCDNLVRKVKILVGDSTLTTLGKRVNKPIVLERPIHKLTVLVENKDKD